MSSSPKSPSSMSSAPASSPDENPLASSPSLSRRKRNLYKSPGSLPSPTSTRSSPQTKRPNKYKTSLAGSETNKSRRSKEVWIPEDYRRKQIERDLNLAKRNADSIARATSSHAPKRPESSLRALEVSKSKERHGLEQRKACGLCYRPFLPINLTMAVPLKAVLDIRDTWGDKYDPVGAAKIRAKTNPNLRRAPACYNQTRVCVFCSQLFDEQQDSYRPSHKTKQADKLRLRTLEQETKKKKDNDPLLEMNRDQEKLSLGGLKL